MLVATVISPADEEVFACDVCELSYPPEDYLILLENKKLAYFRLDDEALSQEPKEGIPAKCLCHECLYNTLLREGKGEQLKVKFIYFDQENYGIVDPHDERGFF